MPRKVVFDIETRNFFHDVGSNDPVALDISIVAIHDSKTNTYTSYAQEEFDDLWPIIEHTDILIGYNSDHFDIPLLNKYYVGDLTAIKSIDLMKEVYNVLGRRLKLDNIAQTTLGEGKSGHGLQAGEWWKKGEVEKIRKYCIDDVRITKELYDYALQNSELKYSDGPDIKTVSLDTSEWEETSGHARTHTLGF